MVDSNAEQTKNPEVIAYELHGNCYLNITDHCTLRCAFCPKFNKTWEVQGYDLRLKYEPSVDEILEAVGDVTRYQQVVFCGLGEPTLRLDVLLAVAEKLKAQGAIIRVNTDGLANLVNGRDVTPEFEGKVDALSISMNAQQKDVYDLHCRPKKDYPDAYAAMLDFAKRIKAYVPSVTLTAIDGLEGVDVDACQKIADEIGVPFRRRVLDEVG
ncbi:TatD family nuclease-associated radical SAM protein [Pseudomonadota bacterium]